MVAAAAYRAGSKIWDERLGKTQDYSRRTKGVVETTILFPKNAPEWVGDPAKLWNTVEAGEKRKDAQLAREFILAVPPELDAREQFQAAVAWAQEKLVASGMIVQVSLHHPKTGNNPHVHVLCTMRKLDGDKFSVKKATEWNAKPVLLAQRESWEHVANAALEKAGRPERIDHRSLKARGIDRIPEPKIGSAAMAMKRRGLLPDPERFRLVRWVKSLNEVRPQMRDIQGPGEVRQHGHGDTWWEKSIVFMSRVRQVARETVMDTWRMLLDSRQTRAQGNEPPIQKGPDISR